MAKDKEFKILHKKSNQVVDEGKSPKLPTSEQLEYGEVAVNYKKGYETLSFKNDEGEIVAFQNDVLIANGEPESPTTYKILIDESVEDENVEIYTKSEVDSQIQKVDGDIEKKVVCGTESDNSGCFIMIDTTIEEGDKEIYTKAEVDALFAKLKQLNPTLKWN